MKKFAFSLEKVLNYKSQLLDILKNELSLLQHELSEIEDSIRQEQARYRKKNDELVEKMNGGTHPGEISSYKIYLGNVNEKIKALQHKKELQEMKIARKQVEIVNMNVEIGSLEKLKEHQFEQYKHQVAKQEELAINEFIGNSMAATR